MCLLAVFQPIFVAGPSYHHIKKGTCSLAHEKSIHHCRRQKQWELRCFPKIAAWILFSVFSPDAKSNRNQT